MNKNSTTHKPLAVTLVDRQPQAVVYLRHLGPYGQSISDFWEKTVYPWMATNNLLGRVRYGISHDDPAVTATQDLRYDAAVEVSEDFVGTAPAMRTIIPGGRYASADFRGTAREIGLAWDSMLRAWLPDSGMQLDGRPMFEYYPVDAGYDATTGVFECAICIPFAALAL